MAIISLRKSIVPSGCAEFGVVELSMRGIVEGLATSRGQPLFPNWFVSVVQLVFFSPWIVPEVLNNHCNAVMFYKNNYPKTSSNVKRNDCAQIGAIEDKEWPTSSWTHNSIHSSWKRARSSNNLEQSSERTEKGGSFELLLSKRTFCILLFTSFLM